MKYWKDLSKKGKVLAVAVAAVVVIVALKYFTA